jgi:hypothetical protein
MRPGPKKPGESAADYNARIKAMEQKFLDRPRGPKTGGGAPSTPRATSPVPPKPGGPVRPRGTSPAPGYGGGKPGTIKPGVKGGMPPVPVTTPKPIKTPIRDGRGSAGIRKR